MGQDYENQNSKEKWFNSHFIFATKLCVFWEIKVSVEMKMIVEGQWVPTVQWIVVKLPWIKIFPIYIASL